MRKKNKFLFKYKYLFLIFFLFILTILFYSSIKLNDTGLKNISEKQKPKRTEVVYTSHYSDRFITENAKISNEKYNKISFVDRRNLLSKVISPFLNRGEVLTQGGLENGTWLWTPIKYINPEYRDYIISGAKKNGINVIYLAIDSYLDIYVMEEGEEKQKALENFNSIIKDFISKANENGIKVDAAAGWQNWAEEGHLYKPIAILDYVISFNKNNEQKFRGFQYDVEVYLLPEYKQNKTKILSNFLDLIDNTVTKLSGTNLHFSVVIPEFYDDSTVETPVFKYKGKNRYTLEHLLSILERRRGSKIIVMSYRNFALGENGSIEISEDEIYIANNYSTKIIIAQETGNFPPSYITFHRKSRSYYESQVEILRKAFENEPSYGGMAKHYVNTYLELKQKPN